MDFAKRQEQELAKRQEEVVAKRPEWDHAKEEEAEMVAFAKRQEQELAIIGASPIDLAFKTFWPFWLLVIQTCDKEGSPKTLPIISY